MFGSQETIALYFSYSRISLSPFMDALFNLGHFCLSLSQTQISTLGPHPSISIFYSDNLHLLPLSPSLPTAGSDSTWLHYVISVYIFILQLCSPILDLTHFCVLDPEPRYMLQVGGPLASYQLIPDFLMATCSSPSLPSFFYQYKAVLVKMSRPNNGIIAQIGKIIISLYYIYNSLVLSKPRKF